MSGLAPLVLVFGRVAAKHEKILDAKQHLAPRGAVAKDGAKKLLGKKGIILVSHLRVQFIIETMPNEDKT